VNQKEENLGKPKAIERTAESSKKLKNKSFLFQVNSSFCKKIITFAIAGQASKLVSLG
jgi:hypothetical protein